MNLKTGVNFGAKAGLVQGLARLPDTIPRNNRKGLEWGKPRFGNPF